MSEPCIIQIENKLQELNRVWTHVEDFCAKNQIFKSDQQKLELALDEILGNIIHYAYPDPDQPHTIVIKMELIDPEYLTVSVIDDGLPFDPTQIEAPAEREADLDSRQPGGLGIYLVRSLLDQVSYAREGNHNVLKITHHIRSLL